MRTPFPFPLHYIPPLGMSLKDQWDLSHAARELIEDLVEEWKVDQEDRKVT